MAEQLTLKAGMDDKTLPGLAKIGKALKDLAAAPYLKQLSAQTEKLTAGFNTVAKGADAGVSSLLGLSSSALGLTGALAGMAAAAKSVGTQGQSLANFSRQTGISNQTLQHYAATLSSVGLNADEAAPSIQLLHSRIDAFKRGMDRGFRFDPQLAQDVKAAAGDAEKELKAIYAAADRIRDPTYRQRFLEQYAGGADLAALVGRFQKQWAATANDPSILTPGQIEAGEKFAVSLGNVQRALEGIKNNVGTVIADDLTKPLNELNTFLNAHQGEIAKGIGAVGAEFVQFGADIEKLGAPMKALIEAYDAVSKFRSNMLVGPNSDPSHPVDPSKAKTGDWAFHSLGWDGFFNWSTRKGSWADSIGSWFNGGDNTKVPWANLSTPPSLPPGIVMSGSPADPSGLADALRKKSEEFGANAGAALTKPLGPADQFGKQAGKSFWEWLRDAVVPAAHADTLAAVSATRISDVVHGIRFGGNPGGTNAQGLPRHRVGGAGIPIDQPVAPPSLRGSSADLVNYIRESAIRHGIDPNVALRVARGEGGLNNPFRHGEGPAPSSQDPRLGSKENSYGPFQLDTRINPCGLSRRRCLKPDCGFAAY